MNGKLHVDKETGQPIMAKNIVIQRVATRRFPDSKLHTYDVSVIGNGEGIFVSTRPTNTVALAQTQPTTSPAIPTATAIRYPFNPGKRGSKSSRRVVPQRSANIKILIPNT